MSSLVKVRLGSRTWFFTLEYSVEEERVEEKGVEEEEGGTVLKITYSRLRAVHSFVHSLAPLSSLPLFFFFFKEVNFFLLGDSLSDALFEAFFLFFFW